MGEASPRHGRWALIALLPLAVIGLLYAAYRGTPPAAPSFAPPAGDSAAVEAPPAEAPAAEATTDAAAGPATDADAPAAPGFDVVRVEPDGQAAIVGTAAPGAKVTIYADEAPLAETEADADGNFVAMFEVAPSAAPRALTLGAVTPEGETASSADVVMLLPRAPAAPDPEVAPQPDAAPPALAAAGDGAPPAVDPAPVVLPQGPDTAPVPAPAPASATPPAAAPEVAATALLRGDSVTIAPTVEAPADPASPRPVTLGAVSYAEGGDVTLAGVGTAGAVVRAYVDDSFAEEGRVAEDGRWSMRLGDVAEGIYRLRIDQLRDDGKVASRIETPFQRDYPRPPPPRPGGGPGLVSVTVQPGSNLWTLARTYYGAGVRYTQIFAANSDQIRDPNLIYPGQIFNIPEE